MVGDDTLSSNMEDYLEAIFVLAEKRKVARSKDIAETLGVNRSSVSGMVQNLSERGFVEHEKYGYVTLTDIGERLARDVARRHDTIKAFFVDVLGLDSGIANEAACRMEHAIPKKVIERLTAFAGVIERFPDAAAAWTTELTRLRNSEACSSRITPNGSQKK